ncbi:MAG: amidohydrolase [Candidatus Competibacteraceae bacterium]|nr:amidohydrolase [Candidatus Competibacteraceae bacterium]
MDNVRKDRPFLLLGCVGLLSMTLQVQAEASKQADIDQAVMTVEPKVIDWRRDIHQHPELGNRETRTAALVADHLRNLNLDEVHTGIAHTGVVGILRGAKPGPVVALRADMDALPITEPEGLPFASKVRTTYNGQEVGVMHACGHDAHTAMLMGVAEVLAGMRDQLPGTVMFIFQPAEEGAPVGEEGGAKLMLAEGVFGSIKPEAIFALHVMNRPAGQIYYTSGSTMAGAEDLKITVSVKQTHGAMPHFGIDPITVSAQIITALQTIPSRQINAVKSPTVISIGSIQGGVRGNIIPDQVEMTGTIRTLDPDSRDDVLTRIERTAEQIAESAGAQADVHIKQYSPVLYNDPALVQRMVPTLQRVAGAANVKEALPITPSEDFAFFSERIPGFYIFLGVNKPGVEQAAPVHNPNFFVNEDVLALGVRALSAMALDYLRGN